MKLFSLKPTPVKLTPEEIMLLEDQMARFGHTSFRYSNPEEESMKLTDDVSLTSEILFALSMVGILGIMWLGLAGYIHL